MPAIRRPRVKHRRKDCRPDSSRRIACPPNKQLPQEQHREWLDVRRAARGDSAARMERDGERNLKDYPCALLTPLKGEFLFESALTVRTLSLWIRFPNCRQACTTISRRSPANSVVG